MRNFDHSSERYHGGICSFVPAAAGRRRDCSLRRCGQCLLRGIVGVSASDRRTLRSDNLVCELPTFFYSGLNPQMLANARESCKSWGCQRAMQLSGYITGPGVFRREAGRNWMMTQWPCSIFLEEDHLGACPSSPPLSTWPMYGSLSGQLFVICVASRFSQALRPLNFREL